ncbi:MAG TPA: hypothetical protein VHZ55_33455 [Bryobacteraceae bacterium]|jgi:hypothetical protein|nr:hypothetical protein [Bryobacteraceae bacterium]
MKPYLATLILSVCSVAELCGQVSTPAAGFVRYPGLPVQAIYGIAGNFLLGPAVSGVADALSFGKSGGLLAGGGHIVLVGADGSTVADYASAENHPLLNIGGTLDSAVAWLPASRTLLWIDEPAKDHFPGRFSVLSLENSGLPANVSSVTRLATGAVRFLLTQADGTVAALVVSMPNGDLKSSDLLPDLRGPAYEFAGYFIWIDDRGLEIGTAAGINKTLPVPAAGSFTAERMSAGWVHLFFSGQGGTHWAINLADPNPSVFRLPAPLPAAGGKRQ